MLMKFGMFTKNFIYFFIILIIIPLSVLSNEVNEKGIVSLMYHRFDENKYPTTNIRIYDFKKHISLIKESNLEFVSFAELKKILIDQKPYSNKKVLLTIDDGFKSFYENAWPILKEQKIPFILFVNTREINNRHPNYMSWNQIREIYKSGIGTIGAHSFSHEYLVKLTKKEIVSDIAKSHQDFKREIRFIPEVFSYPFGEYSSDIKKIVKDFKYILAFGQHSGVIHQKEDLFELPRFPINEAYGKIDRFNFVVNTSPLPTKFYKPEEKLLTSNNPPNIEIEFLNNVRGMSCFSNEGGEWGKSEIAFLEDNWIRIILKEKFEPRRGKINCTFRLKDKSWGWFGRQYVIPN